MEDWELIVKYIKGDISVDERKNVEVWINSSAQNTSLFNEIKATWDSTGKLDKPFNINKAAAWNSIQEKIKTEQKVIPISQKKSNYNAWILRAAAVLIVGLFATWFALKLNVKPELMLVQTTNEQKMLLMPDGTTILLNKNSTLIYPKKFEGNERKVNLEGEAFFEVTKNPEKPFIIENENFNINVLGTSFNVSAYNLDTEARVAVVTGKVLFSNKNGNSQLLLKGDLGVLNKSKQLITKATNLNNNFLSWKTKKLEFDKTNFEAVCIALKNHFSVNIDVKDQTILNCKFTGYFENPTLEEVLKVLEKTLNLKAVVNNKQITITGKGC